MRISDWSSDVCSSDLCAADPDHLQFADLGQSPVVARPAAANGDHGIGKRIASELRQAPRAQPPPRQRQQREIGRASWRERGCQYVYISVVAVALKKNIQNNQRHTKNNEDKQTK